MHYCIATSISVPVYAQLINNYCLFLDEIVLLILIRFYVFDENLENFNLHLLKETCRALKLNSTSSFFFKAFFIDNFNHYTKAFSTIIQTTI